MHRVRQMITKLIGWAVTAGMLWLPAACTWTPLEPVDAAVESHPADTQITVVRLGDRTVVELRSPSGIGRSRITFPDGLPPGPVEFRLHLAGLEQFSLAYDNTLVTLAAGQASSAPLLTAQTAGGVEVELGPESSLWMEVYGPTPGAADPVFRVVAPDELASARQIEMGWIDFFR